MNAECVTESWERPRTAWLTGFAVTDRKAHFFYLAAPAWFDNPRGHFINGFFATSPRGGTLVLASQTADNRVAIVESADEGVRWRLVSQTDRLDDHLYGIGGQRHVTSDGRVVGSFTHD
jgi:hypothetical protein